jgi:hypothetical protein
MTFAAVNGCAQTTTSSADGWVVLPVGEYAALRHAAFPAEKEATAPAVEATLSRLDYDLKVDGDLASGEARLTVDVIREGWVWLPLPAGLMVRDAKLDGQEIDYLPAGEGAQARVEPIYETIEGWKEPTANARSWADLPAQAIKYVRRVEELVGCPIALLSTSPEREDTILVQNPFEA